MIAIPASILMALFSILVARIAQKMMNMLVGSVFMVVLLEYRGSCPDGVGVLPEEVISFSSSFSWLVSGGS